MRGILLLVDFTDEPGTMEPAELEAAFNQIGYTGFGNNGSVRDYFYDVSGGALEYTNWVPAAYMRAPYPKTYYEDPSVQYGQRARQLVLWALGELDAQGHDFSVYDANGDDWRRSQIGSTLNARRADCLR